MKRCFLILGRMGDVLNVMPLALRDFEATGERPLMVVAEHFASILEGVSYVECIPFAGRFEDVAGAYQFAEGIAAKRGATVVCAQIYGEGLTSAESCSSFVRESWAQVPGSPAWGTLPLVFDRRDPAREAAVKGQLTARLRGGKPYVLVALTGTSSPFAHAHELTRHLREHLGGEFDFIDISAFMAPRFYDLLGIMEGAHCLVTIDAGPLHLAHAVPSLPVVAFITREPSAWHGSAWRPQHVGRFFYDEAPDCFHQVARAVLHAKEPAFAPRIWHVWSDYPAEGETARRMSLARETWAAEYKVGDWRPCPFAAEVAGWRTSADVGDSKPMPYVADLIDYVTAHNIAPTDIIAVTNADVCFVPGLTGWIIDKVTRHGAAFTHRYDFKRLDAPLVNEAAVKRGKFYQGSDAFFFTAEWWEENGHEYPAMILGREQCDEVLRQLIKRHGGVEIPGAIYHEKHESFWESDGQHSVNAGNRHNRKLARQWFLRTGLRANDPTWWNITGRVA